MTGAIHPATQKVLAVINQNTAKALVRMQTFPLIDAVLNGEQHKADILALQLLQRFEEDITADQQAAAEAKQAAEATRPRT